MSFDVVLVTDIARYEEKRILEELRRRGLKVAVHSLLSDGVALGSPCQAPYALIRPVSMYRAVYAASFLEAGGCRTINRAIAILLAGDKGLSIPLFRSIGLPIPRTYLALSPEVALSYMLSTEKPLVVKPPIGSWGRLVSLVKDDVAAKLVVEHRQEMPSAQLQAFLIQKYVNIRGEDVRCFVVGGEAIACAKRIAPEGEWRTNVALGAKMVPYEPSEGIVDVCVKAAEAIGADYASVDVGIDRDTGEVVLFEVNGVPEFKGLEGATKANIAGAIVGLVRR